MRPATLLLSLAAGTGLLSLAAAVAPTALAATHSLNLSGPSTALVGQPVVYRVTGTAAPPAEYWDQSWIDVSALPARIVPACPPNAGSATQLATRAGGALLTIAMRPNKDAAGNFTNQVGLTAIAPGTVLICAYTANGVGATLSLASLTLTVRDGARDRPRVTRTGKRLVCRPGSRSSGARRRSYRWVVDGRRVRGASGRTLTLTARMRGRTIRCQVTASSSDGDTTLVSLPLRIAHGHG